MAMVMSPTMRVGKCIEPKLAKYTAHFEMKSPGTLSTWSPKRSTICVEKMVSAIPLVKPTTMG